MCFLPLIHLPGYWNILLDSSCLGRDSSWVALLSIRMPLRIFTRDASLYRTRAWEDGGA